MPPEVTSYVYGVPKVSGLWQWVSHNHSSAAKGLRVTTINWYPERQFATVYLIQRVLPQPMGKSHYKGLALATRWSHQRG